MEEFDGDVVKGHAGIGARDVREVSGRIMCFAILQNLAEFGFADDGVDDLRGAERDVEIREIVLMQERGVQGRDHDVVDASEIVLQHETMMRFLANGNGARRDDGIPLGEIGGRSLRVNGGGQQEGTD